MIKFIRKLKWFLQHYTEVGYDKKIVSHSNISISNHFLGPITYNTDSLVTSNNCDFINDSKFESAYSKALLTKPWDGFTLQWRVYIVCWFADYVKHLPGDFVECGVNTGAYARAVIDYIGFQNFNKKFYLFDTFSGLNLDQISDKEYIAGIDRIYMNNYKDVYNQVLETFKEFNVEVVKGLVPESLSACSSKQICYLSIDMNVSKPEIDALNYFWERIVPGGVILLDDYGFPPHINQKIAFDEFATIKNVEILCLPTGQGIILKPQTSS